MSTTEQKALALRIADEQETLLLEVANGERKPGKLPLEPFVRGSAELRRLSAENEALVRAIADHVTVRGEYAEQIKALRAQVEALKKVADSLPWYNFGTRPAVPEGWRLVPIEPTPEMAKAGCYRFCAAFVQDYCAMIAAAPQPEAQPTEAAQPQCWCLTCRPMKPFTDPSSVRMALCPECGNKRCPKANDHRNACTGSNEPGQPGSAYPAAQKGGV